MKAVEIWYTLIAAIGLAQAPVGSIAGVVRDLSGGPVAGTQIKIVSLATGLARTVGVSEQGDYSFPALLAGE